MGNDKISRLVNRQLRQEPSGYDHNINQARCLLCSGSWHGLRHGEGDTGCPGGFATEEQAQRFLGQRKWALDKHHHPYEACANCGHWRTYHNARTVCTFIRANDDNTPWGDVSQWESHEGTLEPCQCDRFYHPD